MSLLLEALKKAEKAKEEAQRRARGESGGEPEELHGAGEAPAEAASEARGPVLTRDNLPEISQKLEILSDDLDKPLDGPAAEASAPAREAGAAAETPAAAREARAEAGRASARKVFEAKFREPNPRVPFYVTLGVLGAFAVGTVVYFWIELRPPAPLVNANPPRQAEALAVAEARTAPATVTPAQSAIPGLPGTAPAAPTPPAPAAAPAAKPAPSPAPAPQRAAQKPPAPRLAERAAPPPARAPQASATRAAPSVHPKVQSGYAAYVAGNLAAARADYQEAIAEDPANRDALLGLAALDMRAGRYEAAEAAYLRLLHADPRDPEAQAALIALRGGRIDPLAAESRLKSLLAADPAAHALNFTLGNQLAQQGRWAEAQNQYLKAFAAEPDNADFAYNLAVSLDHLRQDAPALQYYRRAIELARVRGGSFDVGMAESRAAQLAR